MNNFVDVIYVSVWDGDAFETDAKLDTINKEIVEIERMDISNEYNSCDEEYIIYNGRRYDVKIHSDGSIFIHGEVKFY